MYRDRFNRSPIDNYTQLLDEKERRQMAQRFAFRSTVESKQVLRRSARIKTEKEQEVIDSESRSTLLIKLNYNQNYLLMNMNTKERWINKILSMKRLKSFVR